MTRHSLRSISLAAALAVASCHSAEPAVDNAQTPSEPIPAATLADGAFQPLQSDQVKDAIHRALATGETQRWQDGERSGYAVPSTTTDKNGCRAVRYTIDQRPEVPFESITACDADPSSR